MKSEGDVEPRRVIAARHRPDVGADSADLRWNMWVKDQSRHTQDTPEPTRRPAEPPNHSHPLGTSSLISTPSNLTFAGHPSCPVASLASLSKPFTASSISSSSRAISAGSSAACSVSVPGCTAEVACSASVPGCTAEVEGVEEEVEEVEARRLGAVSVSGTGRGEELGPARGREGRSTEGRRR
jgi:hypothetical protein